MGIGTNLSLKTKSNWTEETGFNYYFAGKVKGVDSLFSMITNSSGLIIDGIRSACRY
jgi:L-cysteine desulfidase